LNFNGDFVFFLDLKGLSGLMKFVLVFIMGGSIASCAQIVFLIGRVETEVWNVEVADKRDKLSSV